jgi:hypothetical protein
MLAKKVLSATVLAPEEKQSTARIQAMQDSRDTNSSKSLQQLGLHSTAVAKTAQRSQTPATAKPVTGVTPKTAVMPQ